MRIQETESQFLTRAVEKAKRECGAYMRKENETYHFERMSFTLLGRGVVTIAYKGKRYNIGNIKGDCDTSQIIGDFMEWLDYCRFRLDIKGFLEAE